MVEAVKVGQGFRLLGQAGSCNRNLDADGAARAALLFLCWLNVLEEAAQLPSPCSSLHLHVSLPSPFPFLQSSIIPSAFYPSWALICSTSTFSYFRMETDPVSVLHLSHFSMILPFSSLHPSFLLLLMPPFPLFFFLSYKTLGQLLVLCKMILELQLALADRIIIGTWIP